MDISHLNLHQTLNEINTKKIAIILIQLFFFSAVIRSQSNLDWVSLPKEVNSDVYDLRVYNGDLVATGYFNKAGNIKVNRIAAWDGTNWNPLGEGIKGFASFGLRMIVYQNNLYVSGFIDTAGTTNVNGIAKWDGTNWSDVGGGANEQIYSMAVYNNELYAAGAFDSIGGIAASHIAKWNGANWQALGTGIQGYNVNDLLVYKNELYALGNFYSAGGIATNYIARWNGLNWNNVGVGVNYGNTALIEWNGKLLVGTYASAISHIDPTIMQWDGLNWTIFSRQIMSWIGKFAVFQNTLYGAGGGSAGPPGSSFVMAWNSSSAQWQTLGTGVNSYVNAMCEFNGELYCAGDFNVSKGAYHNHIARLTDVTGSHEVISQDLQLKIYPNPFTDHLKIEIQSGNVEIQKLVISDIFNHEFYRIENPILNINTSFLKPGIYLLRIETNFGSRVFKLIRV